MTNFTFDVSKDFGYVLLVVSAIAFEVIITGFAVVSKSRSKFFNREFLEKNFGEEHKKATGKAIGRGGYPDMGTGRYSQKLSYADWLEFNQAQRVHYNFVEQVTSIIVFLIIGGLRYPLLATGFGVLYFVARIFFTFYVSRKGASHPLRMAGAGLCDVALLGSLVLSVLTAINVIDIKL